VALRAQAARSLLVTVLACVLGIAVDDADVGPLLVSGAAVTVALAPWVLATRRRRVQRLIERSREWPGEPSGLRSPGAVLGRALVAAPLGAALIWGVSQASRLYADDRAVLLGVLAGAVASLAWVRLVLAVDVAKWESASTRELLLSEIGLRSSATVWTARRGSADA
jgi:hypothetical protein